MCLIKNLKIYLKLVYKTIHSEWRVLAKNKNNMFKMII